MFGYVCFCFFITIFVEENQWLGKVTPEEKQKEGEGLVLLPLR